MYALTTITMITVTANATRVSSAGASESRSRKRELRVGDLAGEDEVPTATALRAAIEDCARGDVLGELRQRIERRRGDVDRGLYRRVHHLGDEHERDREKQH